MTVEPSAQKWNRSGLYHILFAILFSVLLVLVQVPGKRLFEEGYWGYSAIHFIGILASVLLFLHTVRNKFRFRLNAIDLSFLVFVLLLSARSVGPGPWWVYSKATAGLALVPVYLIVRQYRYMWHFHCSIVVSGVVQLLVATLQKIGTATNINPFFEVGGTVGNPNLLAILLMLTLPSAIFLQRIVTSAFLRNFLSFYIVATLLCISYTGCRSAIAGCIAMGIFLFFGSKMLQNSRSLKIVLGGMIGAGFVGFVALLFLKSGSLAGRLLIWQSCFTKISEKPFWGHGISSFHSVYPEAQRAFLENSSHPLYVNLAGSPQWAYNDFIELWLEGGIFTAIAFVAILVAVLYHWKANKHLNTNRHNVAFLSVIAFFVVSAFNFAFTAWPVLLIFIVGLAGSSRMSTGLVQINFRGLYRWALCALLLLGNVATGIATGKNLLFQYRFKKVYALSLSDQRRFYEQTDSKYLDYAPFTFGYANFLMREGKNTEAIAILQRFNNSSPSYSSNYCLAEAYREAGDFEQARLFYQQALGYIPLRLMPMYQLFSIEIWKKDYTRAASLRETILKTEFKGDTVLVRQIKEGVKNFGNDKKN